jgi:lipopolysaccharide transport system ATP-binding protein
MSNEAVMRVEGVSKKFCRNLRRSLWYGIADSVNDLMGRENASVALRNDEFWAVDNVSFELNRGECIGLIGHNGAGKTTLLKLLSGLVKPDRGRIAVHGRLGALIALGAGFNPILTGRENVYINGAVLGLTKREIDAKYDEIVDFADIGDFIESPVQSYSSGMQVRLGFSIAVSVQPDILLLDEVLAVGDADFQVKCFNTLSRFRQNGTSFILVSHNAHMISRYCDSVLYMRGGKPIYRGSVDSGLSMMGQEMAEKGAKNDEELLDWDTPRGSGRIRFTGAQVQNSEGNTLTGVKAGEPFRLVLGYERNDPALKAVRLDITIRDGDENVYQGDNLRSGQDFIIVSDAGNFVIEFGYFAANIDRASIFIVMLDPDDSTIHDWKRGLPLLIDKSVLNTGRVHMPVNWRIESSPTLLQRHGHSVSQEG